jgi:hypothetical protein
MMNENLTTSNSSDWLWQTTENQDVMLTNFGLLHMFYLQNLLNSQHFKLECSLRKSRFCFFNLARTQITYFDLPRSPSLQFGHVQATRRSRVLDKEFAVCPPELSNSKTIKKKCVKSCKKLFTLRVKLFIFVNVNE